MLLSFLPLCCFASLCQIASLSTRSHRLERRRHWRCEYSWYGHAGLLFSRACCAPRHVSMANMSARTTTWPSPAAPANVVADATSRCLVSGPFSQSEQYYALANPANRGSLAIFSSGLTLSSKKMSLMFAFFLLFFSSFLSAGAASFATDPMRSSTEACMAAGSEPFCANVGGAPKPGRGGRAAGWPGILPGRGGMAPFVEKG
jgi:hypothetical protein